MPSNLMRLCLSATLLLSAGACAAAGPPGVNPPPLEPGIEVPTVLRVALFPYLPDVANDTLRAMQDSIESKFEAANPLVDLQLRRMDPNDGNFYDPDSVKMWLQSQANGAGYHVVEVDAIMLGDLGQAGVMQAWSTLGDSANWMPGPLPALTYNGVVYGIPHWLCGDFILTRDSAVHAAATVAALVAALDAASSNEVKLSGALGGSWTLPALYLHAWADTYGPQGMAGAIDSLNLDPAVIQQMRSVLDFCVLNNGVNTCLAGDTYTPDSSVAIFASGRSDAFLGFSERLTAIMMANAPNTDAIHLSPAPLGPGGNVPGNLPVLYVDALVLGLGCDVICQQAASAFADFMLSDATYQWMLTSQDAPAPRVPRYLLPATRSAFNVPGVAGDPHFQEMLAAVQGGAPLPNTNFAANRKGVQRALRSALGSPIP